MKMGKFTQWGGVTMALLAICLSGCGGGSSNPATSAAVTINGQLETGTATVAAAGTATPQNGIGTARAVDAATGAAIGSSAGISADGKFTLSITPTASQSVVVVMASLANGKTYRTLATIDRNAVAAQGVTVTLGPNSSAVAAAVASGLGVAGSIGDSGVTLPSSATYASVDNLIATTSTTVLQKVNTGYVIDIGAGKGAGVTIFDRTTGGVVKTVRFTEDTTKVIGHFANVTPDGSELWLCNGAGSTTGGVMNVYDTAALGNYSTVNGANKANIVKYSFAKGCGVQSVQSPDGRYLFASADQSPKGINVYDTKNHAYLGNIPNGNTAPHVGAVSPDGKKYYTTTAGNHTVVGYDISGLPAKVPGDADKLFEVDLGYGSLHAVRLHPNGKYLFVGNSVWPVPDGKAATSGTNVVDLTLTPPKIVATIPGYPHNYAISPDGKYLLSSELGGAPT